MITYDRFFHLETRRLGPCSVLALKNGSLDLKCDTPAIHSLVNGNQKLAGKNRNDCCRVSTFRILLCVDDAVKRKILTKSPKDNQGFDDLTSDYTSSKGRQKNNYCIRLHVILNSIEFHEF